MSGIEETICPNCPGSCAYLPGTELYHEEDEDNV